MFKKSLIALVAVAGSVTSLSALAAAEDAKCKAPIIKVASDSKKTSYFQVDCEAPQFLSVTPTITFTGTVGSPSAHAHDAVDAIAGHSDYKVAAKYVIDVRDNFERKLKTQPRADQAIEGTLTAATQTVAGLGGQFSLQTVWDSAGVLSVEERSGKWRVYSLQGLETTDKVDGHSAKLIDVGIVAAGVANTAFKDGRAIIEVDLGQRVSRFAAKEAEDKPVVTAAMGLSDGELVVLRGATIVANHEAVQNALLRLDRGPKDMGRAWGLASRAQMLGLSDVVKYAEQKVAAHNPQLLEEFQQDVRRIIPFRATVN